MATLRRRLHRFNGTSYDVVHFETEAKLVLMNDGTTAEDAINWRMPRGIIRQIDVTTNLFTLQHGIYFAQGDVAKTNNWPIDGAFMGLVIKQGSGDGTGDYYHCVITAYNENTCLVYRNINRYSAWSGWQVDYNSQCMPTLAELSTADGNKIGKLYCTVDDGIYVRAIEGATEAENGLGNGDLFLNYRRPNNTIYMGGNGNSSNVAIHSGNIGSYAATISSLNALTTRVSNLEGSVDMAKLVYSKCVNLESVDARKVTYKASFVRIKMTMYYSQTAGSRAVAGSCGTAYVDIPLGGSGCINIDGIAYEFSYSADGIVSNPKIQYSATLEFYNY